MASKSLMSNFHESTTDLKVDFVGRKLGIRKVRDEIEQARPQFKWISEIAASTTPLTA